MDNINDTIADAWEATLSGKAQLYKKAREMNPEITMKTVSDWWARNRPVKAKYRGYNSFVANYPKQEYQTDLFFLTSGADKDKLKRRSDIVEAIDANKPALLMTDVFSKYTQVVAIADKKPETVLQGLQTLFDKMHGKPELLYTDEEGSFLSKVVQKWMSDNNVRMFHTRGHAAFAERQIGTFKRMIVTRLAHSGSRNWRDQEFLDDVCKDYNTKHEHSVTGMTPYRARMPENRPTVKLRLEANRKMNRSYPTIHINDKVKILEKKKPHEKEQVSNWSDKSFTVEDIGTDWKMDQTVYYTDARAEPFLRHELLKVQT
jgi:hypothetical protein